MGAERILEKRKSIYTISIQKQRAQTSVRKGCMSMYVVKLTNWCELICVGESEWAIVGEQLVVMEG